LDCNDKFLIIASDGLWDSMGDNEVVEKVKALKAYGYDANEIAYKLVEFASSLEGSDNVTVIIIFFKWKIKERLIQKIHL